MSLYKMAIKPGIYLQASFQVYGCASLPVTQIGFFQGLVNGGYPVLAITNLLHSETNPAMANALIHFQVSGKCRADPKSPV
jgi:hypothetical protein